MARTTLRSTFTGHTGEDLAARLDLPTGPIRAYALFAHCFTCSKDLFAAREISQRLAQLGIAVLRFDFTGLGSSEGEFANTNFSSNVDDVISAASYLREHFEAPSILVGHSLGGAAVLAAAPQIEEVKAVATIGAPADVGHVLHQFGTSLDHIRAAGQADVTLAGRTFTITRSFVEDAEGARLIDGIAKMRKALLVLHSPTDQTVSIDNAGQIFSAAKHPKSFVSLDSADHLVTRPTDATYVASIIAAWATRFVPEYGGETEEQANVLVTETGLGKFSNVIWIGRHRLLADEPTSVGGLDSGPSPYDYLSIALGTCTAMTLRMYAGFKNLTLGKISVEVVHGKVAAAHCQDCHDVIEGRTGKVDRFERVISISGEIDEDVRDKLVEIAGKCPVHRTLEASSAVITKVRSVE
ncbi:MAG: bifunctional alpha/beta hydrolase/OsmC family protein [Hyphomicrobiaceae bacterium]